MNKAAVYHRVDSEYCYLLDERTLVLRLRCAKGDLKSVSVVYGNRFEWPQPAVRHTVKMEKVCQGLYHDYYEVTLQPGFRRVFYYFELEGSGEGEKYYYYQGAIRKELPENWYCFFQLPYMRREEVYNVPAWAEDAVMYQIFPDSFATGHRVHDKTAKTAEWEGFTLKSKLGGNLRGIIENIDYLVDLGINVLYLNPVFVAHSYHKYDTIDYKHIDPDFGTDEEFAELVGLLHKNGIRVVLDGVYNHTGTRFFAYQDILKNQEKSPYRDWYYDMPLPLLPDMKSDYACFSYVKQMPKLNTGNPEVCRYFCEIGKYWIEKFDIDGWRLDVANEIDKNFWREYKKAIRSVKKDAIMLAEVWEDAQNWQVYDEFDSAMNYRFVNLCRDFFAERSITAEEFGETFNESLMRYPRPVSYAQMNLLDSHDVSRFVSLCGDRPELLKLAAVVQMTLPGMPGIFAGDERAMTGITEDEYRRPFVWNDDGTGCDYLACRPGDMTAFYKELIALRRSHKALTEGRVRFIATGNENVLAYERWLEGDGAGDKVRVWVNNSDADWTEPESGMTIKAFDYLITF
ncbi:MAG: glycoside hydrolase family 13 protein [Treponema sp.]|nr:glycoside hydrolase family 13 protein [Treponema sp.]